MVESGNAHTSKTVFDLLLRKNDRRCAERRTTGDQVGQFGFVRRHRRAGWQILQLQPALVRLEPRLGFGGGQSDGGGQRHHAGVSSRVVDGRRECRCQAVRVVATAASPAGARDEEHHVSQRCKPPKQAITTRAGPRRGQAVELLHPVPGAYQQHVRHSNDPGSAVCVSAVDHEHRVAPVVTVQVHADRHDHPRQHIPAEQSPASRASGAVSPPFPHVESSRIGTGSPSVLHRGKFPAPRQ